MVYHFFCVALSEVGWRRLGADRQSTWICTECKSTTQLNSPRDQSHSKPSEDTTPELTPLHKIETMLAALSKLPQLVEELRTEVGVLSSRFSIQVLEDLNTRLDDIDKKLTDLDTIKEEHSKLSTKIKSYEDRFARLDKDIKQQNELISNLLAKSKLLEKEYNRSQQQSRFLNIEIVGVPEKSDENLIQILVQIATYINATISADDIEFITRVQSHHSHPGRPRRIIAKLKCRRAKEEIIGKFKKENKAKGITSRDLGFDENSSKVFINEHLTIANKMLLNNCKQRAQELNVKFIWVKNCSIFMRLNETSPPVQIHSDEDIKKLSASN